MNSLWLERFSRYRGTPLALQSAKALLQLKDKRRRHLLMRHHHPVALHAYDSCATFQETLLCEARNAKDFWSVYATLLPVWCAPFSRRPKQKDTINQLLDVGYHHLGGMVEKIITEKDISPSLGLIHRAHKMDSKPLVYDLMELFRADMVDFTLLRYVRLKKQPIGANEAGEHVGRFLHEVNSVRERLYYLRDFGQCHRYGYYMELQIMKFIKAVNRRETFDPLLLPQRHDSRCALHNK